MIGALRKGDRGAEVREVQQRLAQRGYMVADSGMFDGATWRAVRAFQAQNLDQHGQPLVVDGAVARNPKGIDACESVCRQNYAYDGVVIGSHSIRRQFRKGRVDGHDVTLVDVTKTDLAPATSGGGPSPSGGQGDAGAPTRRYGGGP